MWQCSRMRRCAAGLVHACQSMPQHRMQKRVRSATTCLFQKSADGTKIWSANPPQHYVSPADITRICLCIHILVAAFTPPHFQGTYRPMYPVSNCFISVPGALLMCHSPFHVTQQFSCATSAWKLLLSMRQSSDRCEPPEHGLGYWRVLRSNCASFICWSSSRDQTTRLLKASVAVTLQCSWS